jgi:uridine kinase
MIIEGIHALNPELLNTIDEKVKFKIYVSALTQLNMDSYNRVSTTDVRKIRRIVRDHRKRGWTSEETLELFSKVTQGEKVNIFPFQDQADEMFNSTLVYELAILKKHALPLLTSINKESGVYDEARRLTALLEFVGDLPDELIPANSILREFIGGSFFD